MGSVPQARLMMTDVIESRGHLSHWDTSHEGTLQILGVQLKLKLPLKFLIGP